MVIDYSKRVKPNDYSMTLNTDNKEVFNDVERLICVFMARKTIGSFSDGYHTFDSLYHQRAILFATLVNTYTDRAWKSKKHHDGEDCFGGGWFIVGIDTPNGQYTYHYEMGYWSLFNCVELETAPEWDFHTDKDVGRLMSLVTAEESFSNG